MSQYPFRLLRKNVSVLRSSDGCDFQRDDGATSLILPGPGNACGSFVRPRDVLRTPKPATQKSPGNIRHR